MALDGQPTASQLLTFCDSLAGELKLAWPLFGMAAPGEFGTLASLSDLTRSKIMGDGQARDGQSYVGLGSPAWQSQAAQLLSGHARHTHADVFFSSELRQLVALLDNQISAYMPTGWSYLATSGQAHVLDYHLTRLNAINPNTPATPTLNATLTAVSNPSGTLPNLSAGNAPGIIYTLVGSADYYESLPSPACTPNALTGSQNAYLFQGPGNVPNGVSKVRVYRPLIGVPGVCYWDQDALVTPGNPFPVLTITQPDANLRRDVQPPSWMQCLMTPEFAALWAWAYAGQGQARGQQIVPAGNLLYSSNAMLSPYNVLLGPSNGFVGASNPSSGAQFGNSQITGTGSQTYAPGVLATTNMPTANIQGYAGTMGIQARVTSALNGSCTPTLTYTYMDAANGQNIQTATGVAGSAFSGTGIGSLSTFAISAGRLVLSATVTGVSGTTTGGAFVVEGAIRSY